MAYEMRGLFPDWGERDLLRNLSRADSVVIPEEDKFSVAGESDVTIAEVEATAVETPVEPEVTTIVPTVVGDDGEQVTVDVEGDVVNEQD